MRAWKFPSSGDIEDKAGFERYSQIVVIGYKRPQPLAGCFVEIAEGVGHQIGIEPVGLREHHVERNHHGAEPEADEKRMHVSSLTSQ